MDYAVMYLEQVGKKKEKEIKGDFPTIKRQDIMKTILSSDVSEIQRKKASMLYHEIVCMEEKDLKYISEIAVSCREEAELYDVIRKLRNTERQKFKKLK